MHQHVCQTQNNADRINTHAKHRTLINMHTIVFQGLIARVRNALLQLYFNPVEGLN